MNFIAAAGLQIEQRLPQVSGEGEVGSGQRFNPKGAVSGKASQRANHAIQAGARHQADKKLAWRVGRAHGEAEGKVAGKNRVTAGGSLLRCQPDVTVLRREQREAM